MSESISKNNDLENEVSLDMSYFWYSDVTMSSNTNNILTLYWAIKGSTSTSVPEAYLLQLQALHQCHYHYHIKTAHIAGTSNIMADDCSWLWHLTDKQLLTHFNSHCPQNPLWQQCILWPEMNFAILSILQRKQKLPELYLLQLPNQGMVAHLAGKVQQVGN